MSEFSLVLYVILFDCDDLLCGMIGFLIVNIECKLVDVEIGVEIEMLVEGLSDFGEFWVCGLNVMFGYLGCDDVIYEIVDDDGFLYIGDIV